jgi:hypothetical protein
MNVEQASKITMRKPTRRKSGEDRSPLGKRAIKAPEDSAGVMTMACIEEEDRCNTGQVAEVVKADQPDSREGQAGPRDLLRGQ